METQFLSRLCSIPVVSSTISQLSTFYLQKKLNSNVVRLACETAEFGFKVAAITTKPFLGRLEPHGMCQATVSVNFMHFCSSLQSTFYAVASRDVKIVFFQKSIIVSLKSIFIDYRDVITAVVRTPSYM